MSIRKKNILILWGFLGLLLSGAVAKRMVVASTVAPQPVIRIPAFASKSRSIVQSQIQTPEILKNGNYRVVGLVSVNRALPELNTEWILPDGVQLVAGQSQESFYDATPGDELEVQIEIRAENASLLEQVFLSSFSVINDVRMGSTASIPSAATLKAATANRKNKGRFLRE